MQRDRKRTYHLLAVFRVRKADANRLVDEEYVRVLIPRVWVRLGAVRARHPARSCVARPREQRQHVWMGHRGLNGSSRTELHEKPHRRGRARAAVRPENNVVRVGVAPTLEEVEEEMPGLHVDVPGERSVDKQRPRGQSRQR